jgi:SAM-dependent methyltransferase
LINLKPKCFYCNDIIHPWRKDSGFVHCPDCDLVFRFPLPSDAQILEMHNNCYSEIKITIDTTNLNSPEYSVLNHVKYIRSWGYAGENVLDFGAGTGLFAWHLKQEGFLVEGVEFSKKAIDFAIKRYGLRFFESLNNLKDKKVQLFDIITLIETIEHIKRPHIILERLYSILKPGGTIYISTPNRNGINARINSNAWREARNTCHLILFNHRSLSKILTEVGFVSINNIWFSPLTSPSFKNILLHRILQTFGLYGAIRITARKPFS